MKLQHFLVTESMLRCNGTAVLQTPVSNQAKDANSSWSLAHRSHQLTCQTSRRQERALNEAFSTPQCSKAFEIVLAFSLCRAELGETILMIEGTNHLAT